jgi:hypothetical protein
MTLPDRVAAASACLDEPALLCVAEDAGSCSYSQPHPDPTASALRDLWERGHLCDVVLVSTADGAALRAHRLVLAAASGFFRALFTVRARLAGRRAAQVQTVASR